MSMNDDRSTGSEADRLLVGEFVLGLLAPDEHRRIAARIAAEPALAAELRLWQARLSGLDDAFAEAAAPPDLLARLERRLFGTREAGPAGWWHSLLLWRAVAAASLAVAFIALTLGLVGPRPDPRDLATQLVASLEAQEGSGVAFVALYDGAGSVRIAALSGEPVAGRDYELWYIRGNEKPVSMGVIPVEGNTEIALGTAARAAVEEGLVFAVTLEPAGGTGAAGPTGPVVAAGAATPI